MHFWTYHLKKLGPDGFYREHWLHPRSFENAKAAVDQARRSSQQRKNEGQITGKKRINPATGKPFVMGELVSDNRYFVHNDLRHVDKEGFFHFTTVSRKRLVEKRIIGMCSRIKRQSEAKKIPFNLTPEYLMDIYPEDEKCPVLGIEMIWGDKSASFRGPRMNSPSLDRLIPELGYVIGNVNWISMRANYIKQDASPEEILRVADWLQTQLAGK